MFVSAVNAAESKLSMEANELVLQVINECSEAETWLIAKKQQQDALPKHANPVLLAADMKKKAETLDRLACCL